MFVSVKLLTLDTTPGQVNLDKNPCLRPEVFGATSGMKLVNHEFVHESLEKKYASSIRRGYFLARTSGTPRPVSGLQLPILEGRVPFQYEDVVLQVWATPC